MKQVLGDNDRPITGLFRDNLGLVVDDKESYDKYIMIKKIGETKDAEIADLKNKVDKLFTLLESKHGINNV